LDVCSWFWGPAIHRYETVRNTAWACDRKTIVTARVRVRLTQQPTARDLEFFALRFLEVGETYLVEGQMATFLVQWGYAEFVRDEDADDDQDGDDHTPEPDNGSNNTSV
jgi:hypothetical protein